MDDFEKKIRHLFYTTWSFVHHFVAISKFEMKLHSRNAQFGSKSTTLFSRLKKQKDTPLKQHQVLYIFPSSNVNSNWSYDPQTAKLDFDFCDLDLWPWPLLSLVTTPEILMTIRWEEHKEKNCKRRTDGLSHSYSCLTAIKIIGYVEVYGNLCCMLEYLSTAFTGNVVVILTGVSTRGSILTFVEILSVY